jgi:hypothetical protein
MQNYSQLQAKLVALCAEQVVIFRTYYILYSTSTRCTVYVSLYPEARSLVTQKIVFRKP